MDFLAAFHAWGRNEGGAGGVLGQLPALFGDKRPAYAPAHGAHSSEILRTIGFDENAVAKLMSDGVVNRT